MHTNKDILEPVSVTADENDRDAIIKAASEALTREFIGDNPHHSVVVPVHIYKPPKLIDSAFLLTPRKIQYVQRIAVFHLWKSLVNGLVKYEFANFRRL